MTARRKQIWGALHPVAAPVRADEIQVEQLVPPEFSTGYKQPPPQEQGFASATADVTPINCHTARHSGTMRAGAIHTTKQAGNLPDSEVFSRPEFMVSGLGASIRKDGGTTCFVWIYPAPPNDLSSRCVGFQFNKERETMMTAPTTASRSAAPTTQSTTEETRAFALLQASSDATMAKLYLSKGNIAAARRKAVQLLKALQQLEVTV